MPKTREQKTMIFESRFQNAKDGILESILKIVDHAQEPTLAGGDSHLFCLEP
jgi:hypothetical protein